MAQLLTQTLDSQRHYYDGLLAAAATEATRLQEAAEASGDSARLLREAVGHAKELELKAVRTRVAQWNVPPIEC